MHKFKYIYRCYILNLIKIWLKNLHWNLEPTIVTVYAVFIDFASSSLISIY